MRFPVFWLAAAYAAGLAAFADVDDSPRILFALAVAATLAGFVAAARRWLVPAFVAALLGFFLLGGATTGLSVTAIEHNRADKLADSGRLDLSEAVRLTGGLRRAPEHKPFATFYELELESIEGGGRQHATSGGVRLGYFLPPEGQKPAAPPMPALDHGDRVEVLARVHRPVNHLNLGSFDWRGHLALQGIFLEGSLRDPALLTRLPETRGDRFFAVIYSLRSRLLDKLDTLFPLETHSDHNAVLRAMLLGDTGFLSHHLRDQFRQSGTYHVLVVSGLNVGIIAVVVFWILRRARLPEWAASLATIAALVFYLLLVEDRPPIERAVWMAGLYLAARLLFREVRLANTTAVAALVVLFLHPAWVFDSSSHLSFSAVFLMGFFALPWIERTSEPYRQALSFLDAPERAEQLREPRLAQFRYDLRALAELMNPLIFWRADEADKHRAALALLSRSVRTGLRAWDFFLISFAIHLGFVLLTALYFNQVIAAGLLANILVVPLVGVIVPLGLAALLLGLVSTALGVVAATLTGWLVGLLLFITGGAADLGASWRISYGVSPPPPWVTGLFLCALVVLGVAVAWRRWQRWAALPLAALILVVCTHPFAPRLDPRALEVTVLDVGQGDSLFLSFPNGETWLIDGGRDALESRSGYRIGEAIGETVVVPYLRARGVKQLDAVWLTHAHHDHMAGLHAVLEEFPIGSFHAGPSPPSDALTKLQQAVEAKQIPRRQHAAGERFVVGDIEVEILWPGPDHKLGKAPSNNDSLVLRLCRAATCVLLPGDIESKVEKELAQSGAPLRAAALKVPHHGGRDAAGEDFLAAVGPEVAVVSVGATNPFGHPFDDVVGRLQAQAARVYRTDRDGSVTLHLAGDALSHSSFVERQRRAPYANL
ncbi:MAG: DNA internalization-related competence protein ComEC/Rec2, partial [Acidobacteria bacterium]|nr:DNA internalization-related competence protein ComEC/Rec2 [Acidobacteriota bacterium]